MNRYLICIRSELPELLLLFLTVFTLVSGWYSIAHLLNYSRHHKLHLQVKLIISSLCYLLVNHNYTTNLLNYKFI